MHGLEKAPAIGFSPAFIRISHWSVGPLIASMPNLGVNFVLEDLSCADAPMRAVPYSHRNSTEPPDLTSEPQAPHCHEA